VLSLGLHTQANRQLRRPIKLVLYDLMTNELCKFCVIASGTSDAEVVAVTDRCIAFVPIDMASKGHLLLIPKDHFETILDTPNEILESLMVFAKNLSISLQTKSEVSGVNLLHASGESAQQSVQHFHIHLLPRFDKDGLDAWPKLPGSREKLEVSHEFI
jgi:histidine triad (HIT) family protein